MKNLLTFIILLFAANCFATNRYVKNSGTGTGTGAIGDPWKTLAEVNAFVGFANGDSVLFYTGETFAGWLKPIHAQLNFGTYGGTAKATISGFRTLSTPTLLSGNIYTVTDTQVKDSMNILMMDGYPMMKGRTPNAGTYYYYTSNTLTSLTSASLTGTPNYTGADVIKITKSYFAEKGRITSQSTNTINYQLITAISPTGPSPTAFTLGDNNNGFFISGHISTLDQNREWHYDPGTSVLSIYLTSSPSGHVFKAPFVDTLVNINGLAGMSFTNLIFEGANQFAIYSGSAANNAKIVLCEFNNNTNGPAFANSDNIIITNNIVHNSFSTGITVVNRQSEGAIIMNNYVDSSGMWLGQGAFASSYHLRGISFGADSNRNQKYTFVSRNKVKYTGHAGIRFEGSNLFIDSNLVLKFNEQLQDNGGIYSWRGTSSGSTKHYVNRNINWNIIDSCLGHTNLKTPIATTNRDVAGLYFDDELEGIIAHNNTVAHITGIGVQFNTAHDISIRNTTLWKDSTAMLINQKVGVAMTNVSINNNVVYNPNAVYLHDYILDRNPDVTTASLLSNLSLDSNVYSIKSAGFRTDQSAKVSGGIMANSITNLATWKTKTGKDLNSTEVTGTPTFIYNDSLTALAKSIPAGIWHDVKTGTQYQTTVTLQGMASMVLLYDGPASTPPAQPVGLNATSIAATSFTFNWNSVTGATNYEVYLNGILYGSTASTSLPITGLTSYTTYTVKVRAQDAIGTYSVFSLNLVVTTLDNISPTQPTLAVTGKTQTTVTLLTSGSTDNNTVSGYYLRTNGGAPVNIGNNTNYTVTGLTANTFYSFTMQAYDPAGNTSSQSAAATTTTLAAPDVTAPTAPTNLSATGISFTYATIGWTASTDAVGVTAYRVYRNSILVATVTTTYWQDISLAPNTNYTYNVTALDAAGNESAPSSDLLVHTPANTPVTPGFIISNYIPINQ